MHVAKYTRSATGHMINHIERQAGDGVRRSNPNIDASRTADNIDLAAERQELTGMDRLHERMAGVKALNRADVVAAFDWVVTLPQDVPPQAEHEFFTACLDHLCDRYGSDNLISACVHMDESTPHMHAMFAPIVPDPKTGGEKLCCKDVITRADLRTIHEDMAEYLTDRLGYRPDIVTPKEQRLRTADKALDEYKREMSALKEQRETDRAKAALAEVNEQTGRAKAALAEVNEKVDVLQQAADAPQEVQVKAKTTITGRETVTLDRADWERTKAAADKSVSSDKFRAAYLNSGLGAIITAQHDQIADLTADRDKERQRRQQAEAKAERERAENDRLSDILREHDARAREDRGLLEKALRTIERMAARVPGAREWIRQHAAREVTAALDRRQAARDRDDDWER